MSPEESFVLDKLKIVYRKFKKENPDKPFAFDFSKDIDRKVYNNLIQRLAFKILEGRQNVGDQKKANVIRRELGIPSQEIKKDGLLLPEKEDESQKEKKDKLIKKLRDLEQKIYSTRRLTLKDDMFLVGHGINPETDEKFDLIDGKIGQFFDAHGIAKMDQLTKLLQILEKGIDPSKPFFTAPFEVTNEMRAAGAVTGTSGGTAYKDGIAVLTSGYKESLSKNEIKHIFINDVYGDMVEPLLRLYPKYQIHLLSEQKKIMESEVKLFEKK
ncbi:TPA: hypothetical protein DCW61_01960 [Candidatus Uhrbacteria bacterium]|nr:hypothetical protein [Candidatus Uhrbacteria bacterium]